MSPPRPSTLMLDNGQDMELDSDFRDIENNPVILTSTHTPRNRKRKKRASEKPAKKFEGKLF